MKAEDGASARPPRSSLLQAAILGAVAAVAIFVIQRSQDGFATEGAGQMLLWHLLVGAGAFALGAFIRNRLTR